MPDNSQSYQKTISFWDQVFGNLPDFDPAQPLPHSGLEEALTWLGENEPRVLDFGCGPARPLLRAHYHGVRGGVGMDISLGAVNKAAAIARTHGLDHNFEFIQGGIPELKKFKDGSWGGFILFNILDNLLPEHGRMLIEEVHRLLTPGGRLLLLNGPYLTEELQEKEMKDAIPLEKNLFLDENGLYFWNLSTGEIKNLLEPGLEVISEKEIIREEGQPGSRLFYGEKSKD